MERSGGRAGRVLICLNVGVVEMARAGRDCGLLPARSLAHWHPARCFARRVNRAAPRCDTTGKCLVDQRASYCAWGCFSTFLFCPRPALAAQLHRLSVAHGQHASLRLWKPAPP
nr:hypothetical protein BDOA9_0129540 [Bradyrhizobium sp. DOA9]